MKMTVFYRYGLLIYVLAASLAAQSTISKKYLAVADGLGGNMQIPIVTIQGSQPGPRLTIIAGVHGSEYAPILALQELLPHLEKERLSGTVQLVMSASPESFFKRTIFYTPADWKNLNRSFPGRENGSPTERLAYAITTEIIEKCDYLVDVHAGDANEALLSYAAYDADTKDGSIREKSHEMAKALLFPRIVLGRKRPADPKATLYLTNTATHRGKPNVAIESGELGKTSEIYVKPIVAGLENLCRSLGMLPGEVKRRADFEYIESAGSVSSEHSGLFYPSRKAGDRVKKGDRIGTIRSFFGEELAVITAPSDSFILYMLATPPVTKGEPIAAFSRTVSTTQ